MECHALQHTRTRTNTQTQLSPGVAANSTAIVISPCRLLFVARNLAVSACDASVKAHGALHAQVAFFHAVQRIFELIDAGSTKNKPAALITYIGILFGCTLGGAIVSFTAPFGPAWHSVVCGVALHIMQALSPGKISLELLRRRKSASTPFSEGGLPSLQALCPKRSGLGLWGIVFYPVGPVRLGSPVP